MDEGDPRDVLEALAARRGVDLSSLSRLIGRNPAYVQQFIRRGTPRQLAEEDRRVLAEFFAIDERLLGAPLRAADADEPILVPRLDIAAAAGAGAVSDDERGLGAIGFTPRLLRDIARGPADTLSVIRVTGDSMLPTLRDGDDILVDRSDAAGGVRDGIYVLRVDGGLVVKRLAVDRAARRVAIVSDNPDYPRWPDADLAGVDVIGRVVWVGRRLG